MRIAEGWNGDEMAQEKGGGSDGHVDGGRPHGDAVEEYETELHTSTEMERRRIE